MSDNTNFPPPPPPADGSSGQPPVPPVPPAPPWSQPTGQPTAQPADPYAQPANPYGQPASPYGQPANPYGEPAGAYPPPPSGARPGTVIASVVIQWIEAALSLISAIAMFFLGSLFNNPDFVNSIEQQSGETIPPEVRDVLPTAGPMLGVAMLLVAVLWAVMAHFNAKGANWARITSTVLFAINTVFSLATIAAIFPFINWLITLVAVVLLWLPASSAFFKRNAARA